MSVFERSLTFARAFSARLLLIWQPFHSDPFYWSLQSLCCTSVDLLNGNMPGQEERGKKKKRPHFIRHDDGFIAQGGPWWFPWAPTRKHFKNLQLWPAITGWSKRTVSLKIVSNNLSLLQLCLQETQKERLNEPISLFLQQLNSELFRHQVKPLKSMAANKYWDMYFTLIQTFCN